jgi:L,D-transpeptidase YcbB
MNHQVSIRLLKALVLCLALNLMACNSKTKDSTFADNPGDLQEKVTSLLHESVNTGFDNIQTVIADSATKLYQPELVLYLYKQKELKPIWSEKQSWKPEADSLLRFIETSRLYGLFPEDYHAGILKDIKQKFIFDSAAKNDKKNVLLWTRADILLTDAFVKIIKDIKIGRLPYDSVTLRKDSVLTDSFYTAQLELLATKSFTDFITALEPSHRGYHLLKAGIKNFLDSASQKMFSRVPYPEKDKLKFQKALQQRLFEGGFISFAEPQADSTQLATAVKAFQKQKGLTADGVAGEATVRMMNVNDQEKFIRIAISLDKYKMLPEKMPARYIWVNASANMLELVEQNKVKLKSKVICGKAKTRTPLLNSHISELITYPQWVPPPSIVSREILPAVKRNPGYLSRKGFHLVDGKGNRVDPYSVNWSKYHTASPYMIVQGSGDANALGIMKFVFTNKYSVYLHDTNQRYLFNNSNRSLSHGCVRVQEWDKLTWYILKTDSVAAAGNGNYTPADSVKTWLKGKQKKSIAVRNKIPLFIRYFTCEGEDGNIRFYDDVYSEDKLLREKYFSSK